MENIVELPGMLHGADAGSLPQSGAEGCKKKNKTAPRWGAVEGVSNRKLVYSAFLTTAHAILAGEPAEPGAATA